MPLQLEMRSSCPSHLGASVSSDGLSSLGDHLDGFFGDQCLCRVRLYRGHWKRRTGSRDGKWYYFLSSVEASQRGKKWKKNRSLSLDQYLLSPILGPFRAHLFLNLQSPSVSRISLIFPSRFLLLIQQAPFAPAASLSLRISGCPSTPAQVPIGPWSLYQR